MPSKKGSLEYHKVELKFKPSIRFAYSSEGKSCKYSAVLKIIWNKKNELHSEWKFNNLSLEDVKKINNMASNMATCAINLRSKNKKLVQFAELKSTTFKNIVPDSNWNIFEKWLLTCEQIRKTKKCLGIIEKSLFGTTSKKSNVTEFDSNVDGFEQFVEAIQRAHFGK